MTNSTSEALGTVLITGASGFIGKHLRDALLDRGVDAVSLVRPQSPAPERGRAAGIDYADVKTLSAVVQAEKPSHIFHVAGATKGVSYQDFQRANVMPTRNLIEACQKVDRSPRFVLVSSLAAWGPSTPEQPHHETEPPRPIEYYGKSKLEAEALLPSSGLPYTIVRPGGVFGPGDVDYFELFKTAERGFNVYFGNRDRWMSVIYVDDLIELILSAATRSTALGNGYFASDGIPITWETFQTQVVRGVGRKVWDLDVPEFVVSLAAWFGETLSRWDGKPRLANRQKATMGKQSAWTGSIEAARRDLEFEPKVSVPEGVDRSVAWYREQGWLKAVSSDRLG